MNAVVLVLTAAGCFFFLGGTIGLLRFPDVFTRLHALTKADNLGLGLIVTGLAVHADDMFVRLKLILIWLLVLGATATTSHLIARTGLEHGVGDEGQGGPVR
jgi:multicomponent Na+:H+ antiporter subunit G